MSSRPPVGKVEELRRAFFSTRFVRVLDALGYTRFRHWRIYGEEALAGREAAPWLAAERLTVEHGGPTALQGVLFSYLESP